VALKHQKSNQIKSCLSIFKQYFEAILMSKKKGFVRLLRVIYINNCWTSIIYLIPIYETRLKFFIEAIILYLYLLSFLSSIASLIKIICLVDLIYTVINRHLTAFDIESEFTFSSNQSAMLLRNRDAFNNLKSYEKERFQMLASGQVRAHFFKRPISNVITKSSGIE
jgi:hypothetical protein